ncbi:MAG TPA: M14 metallopeptidase family protein [Fimbriiglobus sp.]
MPRSTALLFWFALAGAAPAQSPYPPLRVTPEQEHFGFNLGDDYQLANYTQIAAYWKKLAAESDRVKVVSMGKTEEGRDQLYCIVTSPANQKNLAKYKEIARKLATGDATPEEARNLAEQGKAVVWIDGGLHASEVLCAQAMTETLYQLVTRTDPETMRFLDDVIILIAHANPDGNELCADWYMREKAQNRRSLAGLPRLYQKYIGHDNNRDFYACTQAETKNINRILFREWFPQIVYNHHQTGPAGAVLFCPPFRDPFNYNFDPLVVNGIDAVGAAMMQRFLVENKPGATCRSGAPYSTWFNGGLRTVTYFHNMIGLLTETIGSPTPSSIPYVPSKQLPKADYLSPIAPQPWHFKQSVDYSVTANKAVIDYASRNRSQLLFNIWHMAHAAVERGHKDSWTITPKKLPPSTGGGRGRGGRGGGSGGRAEFERALHKPNDRDPRGFILPSDQPDFLTAIKFANALLACGCTVHKATADFVVTGKKYPAGSLVVLAAQPFRAHVMDMFEPQDYPNDFAYPGGPPVPPYDTTGYTLVFQMGLKADRILDGFEGPFEVVKEEVMAPPAGKVLEANGATLFLFDCRSTESFKTMNRLFKAGEEVLRLNGTTTVKGITFPLGSFLVAKKEHTLATLEKIAAEVGTTFVGVPNLPITMVKTVKPPRIALWDRYGGSMPSGWTRWVLEQFEFPFTVVYPPELDKGNLRAKYDVILFPDGAVSRGGGGGGGGRGGAFGNGGRGGEENIPAEYRGRRGNVTAAVTGPQLKTFLKEGGTILAFGSSTGIYDFFGLPLTNHLVTVGDDGREVPISRDNFYVPGSVLRTTIVDPTNPLTYGLDKNVDVMFSSNPVYRLKPKASGVTVVAKYEGKTPLRSGWAWGQQYLDGGIAVADASVGKGRVVLFAPQVNFRGQTRGAFKLWFNGIVRASTVEK